MSEEVVCVPIGCWPNPQGNLGVVHSNERCLALFECWEAAGIAADHLYELSFQDAWVVRGWGMDHFPYVIRETIDPRSILEVKESRWLVEVESRRKRLYPEWRSWDKKKYHHYVIAGGDGFYEIVASGFTERKIPLDGPEWEFVLRPEE